MKEPSIWTTCGSLLFTAIACCILLFFFLPHGRSTTHGPFASAKECYATMRVILGALEMYQMDAPALVVGTFTLDAVFQEEKLIRPKFLHRLINPCRGGLLPYPPPENIWMKFFRLIPYNIHLSTPGLQGLIPAYHGFCLRMAGCHYVARPADYVAIFAPDGDFLVTCPHHGSP